MSEIRLSNDTLTAVKAVFANYLAHCGERVSMACLNEALAAGLGFDAHAGLCAQLEQAGEGDCCGLDLEAMTARLAGLGHPEVQLPAPAELFLHPRLIEGVTDTVPVSPVEVLRIPPAQTSYLVHKVILAGRIFAAAASSDGLYLSEFTGGVGLYAASIAFQPLDVYHRSTSLLDADRPVWSVVRHARDTRIVLREFSNADALSLAREFGIAICAAGLRTPLDEGMQCYFATTPVGCAFKEWVKDHPRWASRMLVPGSGRSAYWLMNAHPERLPLDNPFRWGEAQLPSGRGGVLLN
jgi:hypothetical protein